MEALTSWLAPVLLVVLFVWLRVATTRESRRQTSSLEDYLLRRLDALNRRFDDVNRQVGSHRERLVELERSVEALVGPPDRGAVPSAGASASPQADSASRDGRRAKPVLVSSVSERVATWPHHEDGS